MQQKNQAAYSVIGSDLTVTGQIVSKSPIQVDGQILGDIHCPALDVGDSAKIQGGIVTEDAVVYGQVKGSIQCEHLTLQNTANVEADIRYKSLTVEQGAIFEGGLTRVKDNEPVKDKAAAEAAQSGRKFKW